MLPTCPHQIHSGWSGKVVSYRRGWYRVKVGVGTICRTQQVVRVGNEQAGYTPSTRVQLAQAQDESQTAITTTTLHRLQSASGLNVEVDGSQVKVFDHTQLLLILPTARLTKSLFRLLGEAVRYLPD